MGVIIIIVIVKIGELFQYLRSFSMVKSLLVKHFDINTRGNLIKSDQKYGIMSKKIILYPLCKVESGFCLIVMLKQLQ